MRKCLVIEDDPSALRFVQYALQQAGYLVLTAHNGIEGLKMAQEEEPDLLILDVLLPGMDGFELCHRLRNEASTAKLLILMLSVKRRESDREMGLKVGANEYLTKPIGPSELVASVGRLLERKGADPLERGHHNSEYLKFWPRDKRNGEGT
jgi:DNA-binding response OmpR family regulator